MDDQVLFQRDNARSRIKRREIILILYFPNIKNVVKLRNSVPMRKFKADVELWFAARDEQFYSDGIT